MLKMYSNHLYKFLVLLSIASCDECSKYKVTDQIYFDVKMDNRLLGRIVFGLFGEVAPITCENFKEIAINGINGKSYLGTRFHTAIERVMIQGGDIVNDNGTGSMSIYGKYFEDENFIIKNDSPGLLMMANEGPDTNGCQFMITTMPMPWLDGKNVIFGKVLNGAGVVHKIEHLKTDINEKILNHVWISKVGSIDTVPFYEASKNYEQTIWAWLKAGLFPLSISLSVMACFQYFFNQLSKASSPGE
ncbi:unnamed protein product [Phaedon cochleariae]|uniref:Peptidyl-prolyl cis-trans isomerase n=1 Tax=Phaedon cochleariae TaxID=80249 RepID=A0A9N9X884_PHACE|nr:unnamed protein product [Phaedon cochleariae]